MHNQPNAQKNEAYPMHLLTRETCPVPIVDGQPCPLHYEYTITHKNYFQVYNT